MLEFHPHGLTSAVGIGAVTDNKGILRVAIQALRAAGYSVPVTAFCLRCFRYSAKSGVFECNLAEFKIIFGQK